MGKPNPIQVKNLTKPGTYEEGITLQTAKNATKHRH